MKESTKRALRTAYQGAIALVTLVPALLAVLPADSPLAVKLGGAVASVAVVSKVLNVLEERGLIPAWMKSTPAPAVPPHGNA